MPPDDPIDSSPRAGSQPDLVPPETDTRHRAPGSIESDLLREKRVFASETILGLGVALIEGVLQVSGVQLSFGWCLALAMLACLFVARGAWGIFEYGRHFQWARYPAVGAALAGFVVFAVALRPQPPPLPPLISVTTLRAPIAPADEWDWAFGGRFEQVFTITNRGTRPLLDLRVAVQFPEVVLAATDSALARNVSPGVELIPAVYPAKVGKDLAALGDVRPMGLSQIATLQAFTIRIADLRPGVPVSFDVRTGPGFTILWTDKDKKEHTVEPQICGEFNFEQRGELEPRKFRMGIAYDSNSRTITLGPARVTSDACPALWGTSSGLEISFKKQTRAEGGHPAASPSSEGWSGTTEKSVPQKTSAGEAKLVHRRRAH